MGFFSRAINAVASALLYYSKCNMIFVGTENISKFLAWSTKQRTDAFMIVSALAPETKSMSEKFLILPLLRSSDLLSRPVFRRSLRVVCLAK
jgi:hypothetical protein